MAQRERGLAAAERRAGEVVDRFGLTGPPVPLGNICRALGLTVCLRPFDYVAGLFINDDVFPVIIVNSRERRVRQRFTIAHELGHYFLRHGQKSFAEPGGKGCQERHAERFAACLLMPAAWVRRYWGAYAANQENRHSILAELFDVSPAALKRRVKELGLKGSTRMKI
jgi:Zn-dependent peptidase ImmA (M78 family)